MERKGVNYHLRALNIKHGQDLTAHSTDRVLFSIYSYNIIHFRHFLLLLPSAR